MNELLKSYVGTKVFVLRGKSSLDCGIFTDKNIGGYGKGIRGDYFYNDDEFKKALSEKGDSLKRANEMQLLWLPNYGRLQEK